MLNKVLKYSLILLLAVAAFFASGYFLIKTDRFEKTEDIEWGVTFSPEYARDLGLDWKKTYTNMLDELPLKSLRLVSYWNEVEPEDDNFNFDDLDWQLDQAEKAGVSVLLTVGYKQPRWPECRKPDWLNDDRELIKKELKEKVETVVNRYKDRDVIFAWQVENEPFLAFGICLDLGDDFLHEEVALVKSLDDTRPIVVTESGELSLWRHAPKSGADILGVTTYRTVWNPWFGRFSWFFLTPDYYRKKAQLVDDSIADFYFVELQAEPWGPDFITEMSKDQQLEILPIQKLEDNIQFGKDTGLKKTYLWGVEWWYYMKDIHNDDRVLDAVKSLIMK